MSVCKLSHVHVCEDYNVSTQDRGQTYICNLVCRPLEMIWFLLQTQLPKLTKA